jgi:hypothetical protein
MKLCRMNDSNCRNASVCFEAAAEARSGILTEEDADVRVGSVRAVSEGRTVTVAIQFSWPTA